MKIKKLYEQHKRYEAYTPKTVKIGNQIWSTKNLDIDDGGEGIYRHKGEVYYTYDAAVRVAESIPGWHLPTKEEFSALLENADFETLTDEDGFNALPVGFYAGEEIDDFAYFWGSSEVDSDVAYAMHLDYYIEIANTYRDSKDFALSVRLIKD